jgi:hypothetical protein
MEVDSLDHIDNGTGSLNLIITLTHTLAGGQVVESQGYANRDREK